MWFQVVTRWLPLVAHRKLLRYLLNHLYKGIKERKERELLLEKVQHYGGYVVTCGNLVENKGVILLPAS
jgi:hypothetical protein